jgi:hypothetical protein
VFWHSVCGFCHICNFFFFFCQLCWNVGFAQNFLEQVGSFMDFVCFLENAASLWSRSILLSERYISCSSLDSRTSPEKRKVRLLLLLLLPGVPSSSDFYFIAFAVCTSCLVPFVCVEICCVPCSRRSYPAMDS